MRPELHVTPSLVTASVRAPLKEGGGWQVMTVKLMKVAVTMPVPCVPPEKEHASAGEGKKFRPRMTTSTPAYCVRRASADVTASITAGWYENAPATSAARDPTRTATSSRVPVPGGVRHSSSVSSTQVVARHGVPPTAAATASGREVPNPVPTMRSTS